MIPRMIHGTRLFGWTPFVCLLLAASGGAQSVTLIRAPHDGFRPRAVLDDDGVLHVVQGRKGSRGDLFYLRRAPGGAEFSEPMPVYTTPGVVAVITADDLKLARPVALKFSSWLSSSLAPICALSVSPSSIDRFPMKNRVGA